MKIRVFSAMTDSALERRVNAFIADPCIQVQQIQFQASFGMLYAMITYDEAAPKETYDRFANI